MCYQVINNHDIDYDGEINPHLSWEKFQRPAPIQFQEIIEKENMLLHYLETFQQVNG